MILQEYEALMRQVCVITCGLIIVYTSRYVTMCCSAVLCTIRSVQGKVVNTYEAGKLNLTRYVEIIVLDELDHIGISPCKRLWAKPFCLLHR